MMRALALALLISATAAAAQAKPTAGRVYGTSPEAPSKTKTCIVNNLLDNLGYASAVEHHEGWRVTMYQPQLGNYWADIQPSATGSTVVVYGTFDNVINRLFAKSLDPCVEGKASTPAS